MHPQMVDALMQTPSLESAAQLRDLVSPLIYSTAGQQTICQMIRLAEEIEKRGGTPKSPKVYRLSFIDPLLACVYERVVSINVGVVARAAWLVRGAASIL